MLLPFQIVYQVIFEIMENKALIGENIQQGSCCVIGTNIPENELFDTEVIQAYKNQNSSVERGFRFLKDPIFFTSTLFLKKPERIEALLMVMTLSLLIYAITERIMRSHLQQMEQTLPNQIKKYRHTSPCVPEDGRRKRRRCARRAPSACGGRPVHPGHSW